MINYIRNLKRLLNMDKKEQLKQREDLKELFLLISDRINHIEDAMLDHRDLLIKLVKQNNDVVKFLQSLEIDQVLAEEMDMDVSNTTNYVTKGNVEASAKKMSHIKELIDEFMERHENLKEFEEELKKVKKLITPGQMGEA